MSIWWTGSSPSPRPPVHSATEARATATTGRRRPKFGAAPGIGWLYLLRCREDPRSIPNARPHTKRGALDAELGALSMPNPRLAWRSRCRTGCARAPRAHQPMCVPRVASTIDSCGSACYIGDGSWPAALRSLCARRAHMCIMATLRPCSTIVVVHIYLIQPTIDCLGTPLYLLIPNRFILSCMCKACMPVPRLIE